MTIKHILFAGLLLSSMAHADMVVIANPHTPFSSLPQSQLRRLFLGQTDNFPDGTHALPLDVNGEIRNTFYQNVLNKKPEQVEKYWARMIFTGKAEPPRQVRAREVKNVVAETPGAISYVDSSEVDASVKVLTVVRDGQ
jgi:ABC-type phosphate transport system substrate-binding protein